MRIMAARTEKALLDGRIDEADALLRVQLNFLRSHIASWIPQFSNDMLAFSQTDFYRGLAHLLSGFAKSDEAFLSEVAEQE